MIYSSLTEKSPNWKILLIIFVIVIAVVVIGFFTMMVINNIFHASIPSGCG
ncbi:MAG: hypothetical protein ACTSQO_13180 [Candidatus Helarchaeota archaeon]